MIDYRIGLFSWQKLKLILLYCLKFDGFRESYYTKARQKDVGFIRYEEDRKPEVSMNGNDLQVEVFDRVLNIPLEIAADLVILSAGIIPGEENEAIAKFLKVSVKKTVETDETACKGCGTCQATCPKQGIFVKGFKLEQIAAQVEAALGIE